MIDLLHHKAHRIKRVCEYDLIERVLDDGADSGRSGRDRAVDRICDTVAAAVLLGDLIAQADRQVFDLDLLACLQGEGAALVEDQIV